MAADRGIGEAAGVMLGGLILSTALAASQTPPGTRNYGIGDFDRIRVEGALTVTVATGRSPSARAQGSAVGLDALVVRLEGRTLVVRMSSSARTQFPGERIAPPVVTLSVPALRAAIVLGAGQLDVDRMRAPRVDLAVTGSGRVAVAAMDADRVAATMTGNGTLTVAGGRADIASFVNRGGGTIDARTLAVRDLTVSSESAGDGAFTASRTARVTATGAGDIIVTGAAACTVASTGAGEVVCGEGSAN